MFCEILCYYSNDTNLNNIANHLEKLPHNCKLVTNNPEVYEFSKRKGRKVFFFESLVPDREPIAHEAYREAKELHKKYQHVLQDLIFDGIKIFRGYDFSFLRRLYFIMKVKKILEKKEDTVFIFDGFSLEYFAIIQLLKNLGYESKSKVGFIKKNKIEYISANNKDLSKYERNFSFLRISNFVKLVFGKKLSISNIKSISRTFYRLFMFVLNRSVIKYSQATNIEDVSKIILEKIDRKILKTRSKYDASCAVFITSGRLDLNFRPWEPVLKKFEKSNVPYQLFTSDLVTSLLLSEQKISFINLFEEVNILSGIIKTSITGKLIRKKFDQILVEEKSLFALEQLSPYLLATNYRSFAVAIICDNIIKNMKNLKSIIAATDGEMLENLAVESSKKYKIQSFAMIHGMSAPLPIYENWFHAEKIFVSGTYGVESLKNLGYDPKRIIMTGNPKYDYFKTIDPSESKDYLKKICDINKNKKLIIVAMSFWHKNDDVWISDLIKFCNQNNFEIIIKIHPKFKLASHKHIETKIKIIKKRCKNLKFLFTYDVNISKLLSSADLVITDFSSVGLEVLLLEKPLLTVNFAKQDLKNFFKYHEYDASIYVEDYRDLEKVILEILKEGKHLQELKEGGKKIIENFNFYNDGKSSERILENLMKS